MDEKLLEAVRVAKRKHSPEAFIAALRESGYVLVELTIPVETREHWLRWDGNVDSVFTNSDGTLDLGAYDDLELREAGDFMQAVVSAVTHLKEQND